MIRKIVLAPLLLVSGLAAVIAAYLTITDDFDDGYFYE